MVDEVGPGVPLDPNIPTQGFDDVLRTSLIV